MESGYFKGGGRVYSFADVMTAVLPNLFKGDRLKCVELSDVSLTLKTICIKIIFNVGK